MVLYYVDCNIENVTALTAWLFAESTVTRVLRQQGISADFDMAKFTVFVFKIFVVLVIINKYKFIINYAGTDHKFLIEVFACRVESISTPYSIQRR